MMALSDAGHLHHQHHHHQQQQQQPSASSSSHHAAAKSAHGHGHGGGNNSKAAARLGISAVRVSVPVGVVVLLGVFFTGSLYGSTSFSAVPDLRQRKPAPESSSSSSIGASAGQRRQLAAEGEGAAVVLGHASDVPPMAYEVLSWRPRAFLFKSFVDQDTCNVIMDMARRSLYPSGLALRPGETMEGQEDVRTSSGTFLTSSMDKTGTLSRLEKRMADAAMIPVENGEAFNVLRYAPGQKYDAHMDSFDPKDFGPQQSQRIATFLLYLTDVEEGGETYFPYADEKNMDSGYNYKECIGLKVKPKAGDAILFWSTRPNGELDKTALHGSCPVVKGEKWAVTKWMRDTGSY